jgi:hypothetical protein
MSNSIVNWFKREARENRKQVMEYLYVDRPRLSAYVDQLRSPIAYDKIPVWSAELSIPGPTAKAEQSRPAREYTLYEQIAFLEQHLRDSNQLATARWDGDKDDNASFRIESFLARRAIITDASSGEKLGVWVSRYNPSGASGRAGTLILFEGVHAKDERPDYLSSYSWLLLLFMKAAPRLSKAAVLGGAMNRAAAATDESMAFLSEHLTKNPLGFLVEMGADIMPQRSISCLYRVRAACLSVASFAIPIAVTFGYPIYIAEASPQSVEGDHNLYSNDAVAVEVSREQHEEHLGISRHLLTNLGIDPGEVDAQIDQMRRNYDMHQRRSDLPKGKS